MNKGLRDCGGAEVDVLCSSIVVLMLCFSFDYFTMIVELACCVVNIICLHVCVLVGGGWNDSIFRSRHVFRAVTASYSQVSFWSRKKVQIDGEDSFILG